MTPEYNVGPLTSSGSSVVSGERDYVDTLAIQFQDCDSG